MNCSQPVLGFVRGDLGKKILKIDNNALPHHQEVQAAAEGGIETKAKAKRSGLEQGTLPAIRCDTEVFVR